MAARLEHVDMVVGGATHEPKDYFRLMIRFLARDGVCCEAGVFVLPEEHPEEVFPHNIVVFGDVGVNATMTPDVLAYNAVETCAVARDLIPDEVLPEVHGAIVSYSNRGSDEGPSPELVRRAVELVPEYLSARVKAEPPVRHDPNPGRGQGLRGALPALGHVLPEAQEHALARQSECHHLPQPGHGEPAVPPLRHALSHRPEVPGHGRAGIAGR